jgi:hypothetical protein
MKGFKAVTLLWTLLAAGCALPLGEDYLINRDGGSVIYIKDYDLLNYVPVPKPGEGPVTQAAGRADLELTVVWKDETGVPVPLPFNAFAANTVYQADITLRAKSGYGFYPSTPFAYPAGRIAGQTNDLGELVRIITVTYNNSDDADFTFVTNYNLQNYVPVPMAGEKPVRTIDTWGNLTGTAGWKVETSSGSQNFTGFSVGPDTTFGLHTVYQAEITLTAADGYRFYGDRNFTYPDGTPAEPQGDAADSGERRFLVTYNPTRTPTIINDHNLTSYVPKPQSGITALGSFAAAQYTGTIKWKTTGTGEPLNGPFQPNTAYTAELTLIPVAGYTITGLGGDFFIHTGAVPETCGNSPGSGVVTLTFPATGSFGSPQVVYDTNLTGRVPKPVIGMTPVTALSGTQYSGSVNWVPFHSSFQEDTSYKAVLVLNPAAGYTFDGIGQNVFSYEEAAAVTNLADSGTVTITFPPAASSTYQVIGSFGPADDEASALWMMRELKDDTYPLLIDLPYDDSEETVEPVALLAGQNCPPRVIINGHGRTLKIQSQGTLLTVGGGVVLSLENIILEGSAGNNAPLVRVEGGGTLRLGTGAVLTGNHSAGNAGGVSVDGGTLILSGGGVIRQMSAAASNSGGGVRIDGRGSFTMSGGTIGGADLGAGNRVSAANSAGGVYIADGTMNMYGGAIQYNQAEEANSAGGVYIVWTGFYDGINASFLKQYGGLITDNTASGAGSGGGVYVSGLANFRMEGTAQVAENNRVFLQTEYAGIIIDGPLSASPAANITFSNPADKHYILGAGLNYKYLVEDNMHRFLYEGDPLPVGIKFTHSSPYYFAVINPEW